MNKVVLMGKIQFEPENKTRKHNAQASWKRVAMVMLDGDVTEYYSWFVMRRYGLQLVKPMRGAHISFINDSNRDLSLNGKRNSQETDKIWQTVKARWDGKKIPIMLNLAPRFDSKHWWLNVDQDYRDKLQGIRDELGLGKPYFGFHMSMGYANEKNVLHHEYITRNIKNGMIP